jgi:AcrR family transcriptional regulator
MDPARSSSPADPSRELLLDAAGQLFARNGFADTTADQVAAVAGVPLATLHAEFGGTERLLVEVVNSRIGAQMAEAGWLAETGDRPDAAAAISRLLVSIADKETDLAPLEAELWQLALRRPDVMEQLAARDRMIDTMLTMFIRERFGLTDPGVEVPAEALATVLQALVNGIVQRRRTDPDAVPEELFGQALQWMLAGIRASAS